MPAEMDTKIALIRSMIRSLGKLADVEIRLSLAGKDAEANDIRDAHDRLRQVIDNLRGQVARQWTAGAQQIEEEIRKRNTKVQDSIRAIQNQIGVAENVAKILGQVDDAINMVRGLVPGL